MDLKHDPTGGYQGPLTFYLSPRPFFEFPLAHDPISFVSFEKLISCLVFCTYHSNNGWNFGLTSNISQ